MNAQQTSRDGGPAAGTVAVSSGFHKTHETVAAREASARGLLSLCITGAYPSERVKRVVRALGLGDHGRIARLLDRDEGIPQRELKPLFIPELLDELARILGRLPLIGRFEPRLRGASWRLYGWLAARVLGRAEVARIYHYRAGFGQASAVRAKARGMLTLCDRSLAHPELLDQLIERRGRMPTEAHEHDGRMPRPDDDPLERAILTDIDRADAVLVNSDFVKETFLLRGWPANRVHVIYLGVDDNFLRGVPHERREATGGGLGLLFAGRFERRKGAETLIEALSELEDVDWELRIAGPVEHEIRAGNEVFLGDPRVKLLGPLRRRDLMREMLSAPVFVFPSFAEGSARVVFEALACGCYVITTPNSGSIVEEGVHGAVVAPWDVAGLREAIVRADADRPRLAEIGNRNAELVAERYTQSDYGDALERLYRELMG